MKPFLVSIHNSGESVEKTLTLYYYAYINNKDFYDNYNVKLFYGNNLAKKSKNISAHGSVEFYSKYFSNNKNIPSCSKEYYLNNKKEILDHLLKKAYITYRSYNKLINEDERYWKFVKSLPFYYIYPDFIQNLINIAQKKLGFYSITNLFCEKNYLFTLSAIQEEHSRYSIFGLSTNGIVGRYYLNYKNEKKKAHLFSNLLKLSVLSGNTAFFIKSINCRIGNNHIIGFRNHSREVRPNREYAIADIIKNKKTVIEPKNSQFNKLYQDVNTNDVELKNNIVYAKGFNNLLNFLFEEE